MEANLNQQISQAIPQISLTKPSYDHIVLTEEEAAEALRIARSQKHVKIEQEKYWQKVNAPKQYEKLDYDQLYNSIRMQHNVIDVQDQNFGQVLESLKKLRKEFFVLDNSNRQIFETLCLYFSEDPAFELENDHSFRKGIILRGPVGCGKTTLMRMFSINSFRPFEVVPCRSVADDYTRSGSEVLKAFAGLKIAYPHQNFGHSEIGRCFDDLGTEETRKNFGNEANVMQDVIYKIYDARQEGKFHMTTNLNAKEIAEFYGDRVKSRVFEMFNVISFEGTAKDRRVEKW